MTKQTPVTCLSAEGSGRHSSRRLPEDVPQLNLGVIGRTGKENERRLPIHPDHFDRIEADLRASIYVERGYGEPVSPTRNCRPTAGVRSREELIAECDVILLIKPDARSRRPSRRSGAVGWPHCVQDRN